MSGRPYRVAPWVEGLLVGLITLLALGSSSWFIYVRALTALEGEIKDGLLQYVSGAATTLDGDLHRTLGAATDTLDAAYAGLVHRVEGLRTASPYVRYAYTCISVGDDVFFVVNGAPQNDNDGDGQPDRPPRLMDAYPDAGGALLRALQEQVATVDDVPYEDQWGRFYSAYAPFYDSQGGFVGVLGMDLETTGFEARLQPTITATKRAAITTVVIAILCGVIVWFCRRLYVQLGRRRRELAEQLAQARRTAAALSEFTYDYVGALRTHVREWFDQPDAPPGPDAWSDERRRLLDVLGEYVDARSGRFSIRAENFDLPAAVEDLGKGLAPVAAANHMALTWSVSDELPKRLHSDWRAIEHVISLLVGSDLLLRRGQSLSVRFDLDDEGVQDLTLRTRLTYGPSPLGSDEVARMFTPFARMNGASGAGTLATFQTATARLLATLLGGGITASLARAGALLVDVRIPLRKEDLS